MNRFKLLDRVVIGSSDEVLTVIQVDVPHVVTNSISTNNVFIGSWGGTQTLFGKRGNILYKLAYSDGLSTTLAYEEEISLVGSARKQLKSDLLKMYVLVKNSAPIGLGINAVGHVTFMAANSFHSEIFNDWKDKSFKKVTCLVSPEEFEAAIAAIKEVNGNFIIFNENDWGDQDLSVAFEPRYIFPDIFKKFKLHSGVV